MNPPLFPAGEYAPACASAAEVREAAIKKLEQAPMRTREAVTGLNDEQLNTKYRNWTIRQIVHHLADSHINCYVRFKWSLTEDTPHIKSYDETLWSEVVDARAADLESSLTILEGIHRRWCDLVRGLNDEDLRLGFFHPEPQKVITLQEALPNYAWHVDHHLAQIAWLREQYNW